MTPTRTPRTGATYRSIRHPENVVTVTAVEPDAETVGKGGIIIRGRVTMERTTDGKSGSLTFSMFDRAYQEI